MMPDENDDRIAAFLAEAPGMARVDPKTATERSLGPELGPRLVAASRMTATGVMMTPAMTGTDGFFVSVLERKG